MANSFGSSCTYMNDGRSHCMEWVCTKTFVTSPDTLERPALARKSSVFTSPMICRLNETADRFLIVDDSIEWGITSNMCTQDSSIHTLLSLLLLLLMMLTTARVCTLYTLGVRVCMWVSNVHTRNLPFHFYFFPIRSVLLTEFLIVYCIHWVWFLPTLAQKWNTYDLLE